MIIRIDSTIETPMYQQLYDQIVIAIATGTIAPGDQLPAVRQLATETGINMMTVAKTYNLLKNDGYLLSNRSGTRVNSEFKLDPDYLKKITPQLTLLVATAIVNHVPLDSFLETIKTCYHQLQIGDQKNE